MPSSFRSISPQDETDVIGDVEVHSLDRVATLIDTARTAARDWAAMPALERSQALQAAASALRAERDLLVDLIVREVGKPVTEAQAELTRAEAIMRFYAQMCLQPLGELLPPDRAGGTLLTKRRPHGVVGMVTPWNFPVAIPVWKAAPAIAVGNAVVLKPSPASAVASSELVRVVAQQLPPNVLTVVHGDAEVGEIVTTAVDAVSFTGSTSVGRQVVAAATQRFLPVQAEMGGHNPTVVLPDADIDLAAAQLATSIAGYAGQKCTATRRVVTVGRSTELVDALAGALDDLTVGDPALPTTHLGPVISTEARERIDDAVRGAVRLSDAKIATRRTTPDLNDRAPYAAPTLLTGARGDATILKEEVFGPVATVIAAKDDADAVRIANDVDYGLAAAVIGRDLARTQSIADRLHAGMVKINEPTTGVSFHGPFGGEKSSSFGPREQGREALEMFTWKQTLTVSPTL